MELGPFLNSIFAVALGLFLLFVIAKGAPFVPSRNKTVQKMVSLAGINAGDRAADLGSGNGKIVIAIARAGAEAHGYEINPLLVWWSRVSIRKAGLTGKAFIHTKNFWKEDLSGFNVITLYGIDYIMSGLEKKLKEELPSGARIVSNSFKFPNWPEILKEEGVYLYKK